VEEGSAWIITPPAAQYFRLGLPITALTLLFGWAWLSWK
jgi:hypothetical protein